MQPLSYIFHAHAALSFRRAWDDVFSKLGDSFDLGKLAGKMSDVVLRRAKALFDSEKGHTGEKRPAESSGQQQQAAKKVWLCVLWLAVSH